MICANCRSLSTEGRVVRYFCDIDVVAARTMATVCRVKERRFEGANYKLLDLDMRLPFAAALNLHPSRRRRDAAFGSSVGVEQLPEFRSRFYCFAISHRALHSRFRTEHFFVKLFVVEPGLDSLSSEVRSQ